MNVQMMSIGLIKPNSRNSRTHSAKQVRQIANSIGAFGFTNPLLVSEDNELIAGHGRYLAAKQRGLDKVPVIVVAGLSPAKRRALAIADNKIAENAGWDRERLAIEIPELGDLLSAEGLDISILGFEPIEIERLQGDITESTADPGDQVDPRWCEAAPVSKAGDLWGLGNHQLLCGDARSKQDVARLMADCCADLAFLDPPHGNVPPRLLPMALDAAASFSRNGAFHFICAGWQHMADVMAAATPIYGQALDLAVWAKSNTGQGCFYRGQNEFVIVFRFGESPAVEAGRPRRLRSSIWHHPDVNAFTFDRGGRPWSDASPKPVGLVADAIKDCTRKGDVVLDTFAGFGTTLIAAERVGRHARALEIEPWFVVRRWQAFTRQNAVHVDSGRQFNDTATDSVPAKARSRSESRSRTRR